MTIKATEKAIEEMNKHKIDEKDILIDRAIIKNQLNPLERLLNVEVRMEGKDKIKIKHPNDEKGEKYTEIKYVNNRWEKK